MHTYSSTSSTRDNAVLQHIPRQQSDEQNVPHELLVVIVFFPWRFYNTKNKRY